jgi:hydroxymethylpyrimidine pyrophosphatase-like HAD family hydrolase
MCGPVILATDLDGTFAHGTTADRERLVSLLQAQAEATLIYVTGRTPDAARELAARTPLPEPDLLIADVGTSVLRGLGPGRVTDIEAELGRQLARRCGDQAQAGAAGARPGAAGHRGAAPDFLVDRGSAGACRFRSGSVRCAQAG